jgi:hypothetical protein
LKVGSVLIWGVLSIVLVVSNKAAWGSPHTGIRSKNVVVQEYWSNNRPFYVIANLSDSTVTISVREYRHWGTKNGHYGSIAAEWQIATKEVAFVSASILTLSQYVQFLSNGKPIGLLVPMRPTFPERPEGLVTTESSMNYWGGQQNRRCWFEQSSVEVLAESDIEITLVLRLDAGEFLFGNYVSLLKYTNPGKNLNLDSDILPLPILVPIRATCETLSITTENDVLIIAPPNPEGDISFHRIKLYYKTPRVDRPTPVAIVGIHDSGIGKYHVARMFVVVP